MRCKQKSPGHDGRGVLKKLAVLLVGPSGLRLGFAFLVGDSAWPSDGVLFDGFDPVALGFVIDFELSFLARFLAKERLTKRREICLLYTSDAADE